MHIRRPVILMFRPLALLTIALFTCCPAPSLAQNATSASPGAKPLEHLLGTVTAVDASAQTITVKDDKSGAETVVSVGATRTLLKVAPGAKDLKSAVRITAGDLQTGDRVDVRGSKPDDSAAAITARSVVLMSARELAQKRQAETEAWQNSTVGTITAINAGANSFAISIRTPEGPKPVTVQSTGTTEWTRYSSADPKVPVHSAFADLQVGDQIRMLGQKNADDSVTAQKVYSAPVRTIAATVTSISPDGKQIIAKNVQSKQPVTILLPASAVVRKLDPQMAMLMARRFSGNANGNSTPGGGAQAAGGSPTGDHAAMAQPSAGAGAGNAGYGPGAPGAGANPNGPGSGGGMRRGGDLSHMLERIPEIAAADLKPGDAIVIWGMAGQNSGSVDAQTVLAGVEPILQSSPPRQGQSLSADWGLDTGAPAQ